MSVESVISLANKPHVEPLLIRSRFVTRYEQDCVALRVEREGNAPNPVCGIEPQLLHVHVARRLERVDTRPPQTRPESTQQVGVRQNLVLHRLWQSAEIDIKIVVE